MKDYTLLNIKKKLLVFRYESPKSIPTIDTELSKLLSSIRHKTENGPFPKTYGNFQFLTVHMIEFYITDFT